MLPPLAALAGSEPFAPQALAATPEIADADDPTPALTEGPYFTPNSPLRQSIVPAGAPGARLTLSGRVLSTAGKPIISSRTRSGKAKRVSSLGDMPVPQQWSAHADRARGLLLSVVSIAAVTGMIYALRPVAPVLSLGVLYVIAVVVVAVARGLAYAIPVSVASMLTFNYLFLPPVRSFALHESSNWVALGAYLATAVVVSELATRSRRLATKAVEAETLRQSDAVKTAILQAVSHDLRSPLTAIRAASDGLVSDELALTEADRRGLSETIGSEVRRLERLVENLLDLSRLEAGPARRHPELWTADTLLATALEQIGSDAASVSVTLPAELPPTQVDGAQIERVLVNLLENALAYSPTASRIDVAVSAEGEELHVQVRDRGPGVAGADRERIFEPFERGGGGGHGSGLGLAIARGFAEANGGRIWLEPADAEGGATFVLALPAEMFA